MVKLGRTKSERVLFLWLTGHGVILSGTVMLFLPQRYRTSVITHQAVTLYASIVTALLKRERTGEGAMVHTSLLASGLWSTSCIAQTAFVDGDYLEYREFASKRRLSRTTLDTADERYFIMSMARTPEKVAFLLANLALSSLLQDKIFQTPEIRCSNNDRFYDELQARIMMEPAAHWRRQFEHHQVPASLAGRIEEMAHGPQVLINEMTAPPNEPSIRGAYYFPFY